MGHPEDDLYQGEKQSRFVCVMPVHGRPEITIDSARRLSLQTEEVIVLMVGDETNKDTAKEAKAEFLEMPNRPVWKKIQEGFREAKQFNPDGVLFLGSDDWLSDNYLSVAKEYINANEAHYLAGFKFYIFDSVNYNFYLPNCGIYHLDSGEVISAYGADKVNWDLADNNRSDFSTGYGRKNRFTAEGFKRTMMHEVVLLVVQGKWNSYHTLDMYTRLYGAKRVSSTEVLPHFKRRRNDANIKL